MTDICNICKQFESTNYIPEIECTICELCSIKMSTKFKKKNNYTYYPPKYEKRIDVFDDGNQKFQHLNNNWLQIGHQIVHPEKIFLVNKFTNDYIESISLWKTSTI